MDDQTLERVARRIRTKPESWAWVFDRYDHWRGPAAGALAAHLALSPRDLLRLGLYLRPRAGRFEADLRQAAADFAVDPARLAGVVRFVDAMEAMAAPSAPASLADELSPAPPSVLAAARARRRPRGPRRPRKGDEGNGGGV